MRVRTAAPLVIALLVAAGSQAPAEAAKKKPVQKSYSVQLPPVPDLTESQGCDGGARQAGTVDIKSFKVTGPGKLVAKITGFQGDWDMSLWDAKGSIVATGDGTSTPNTSTGEQTESMTYKYKKVKPATFYLHVCNFLGTPSANVKYVFTYA